MSASIRDHVAWQLPLTGRRLIEASAGTGKTWTLTGLVVRLVLGLRDIQAADDPSAQEPVWDEPLMPHQILVVTFTEAATAELRERVHARLALAVTAFAQPGPSDAKLDDEFLSELRRAIPTPFWPQAQARLTQALANLDEAAIHTLHGWALRTLKRHALTSGQAFGAAPVPQPMALHRQAVRTFWRSHITTLPAEAMQAWTNKVAKTPEDLLAVLKRLWAAHERSPHHTWPELDATAHLNALTQWSERIHSLEHAARAAFCEDACMAVHEAVQARAIRGYQANWLSTRTAHLRRWLGGHDIEIKQLSYWGSSFLGKDGWQGHLQWSFSAAVQSLYEARADFPQHDLNQLLTWAAGQCWHDIQARKQALDQFEFNDLLRRLHQACHDTASNFCERVRETYPAALVDEFQDTDPWQYESLAAIYPKGSPNCWVMIGDPKQSIYRFRGADLPTYQIARNTADSVHSLQVNFRSTPKLIQALNQVFDRPDLSLLHHSTAQVEAGKPDLLGLNQGQHPAIWVSHWPAPAVVAEKGFKPVPRKRYEAHMAQLAAHTLVTQMQSGWYTPNQVAILVRDKLQARVMAQALQACGLASVFLSDRNSVLAEPIALDVWRLLRAFDEPEQLGLMRAAMATALWALPLAQWEQALLDDEVIEAQQALCLEARERWDRLGVLAALQHWLHASGAAARWLAQAQGERLIGQFTHLGQWLQAASTHGLGRSALLRRLSDEMQSPNVDDAAAQARLYTDAPCITLVTVHKSKGLEYDVVMVPFLSTLSKALSQKKDEGEDADASEAAQADEEDEDTDLDDASSEDQQAEDLRLLYVALTRARLHLWLGVSEVKGEWIKDKKKVILDSAPLCKLLQRQAPKDLWQSLQTHWHHPNIHLDAAGDEPPLRQWMPPPTTALRPALQAPERTRARWRVSSYSGLTRRLDDAGLTRAADEGEWQDPGFVASLRADPRVKDWEDLGAGRALGVAIHTWLEWQFNHGWPLAQDPDHAASLAQIERMAVAWQLKPAAHQRLLTRLRELVKAELPLPQSDQRFELCHLRAPKAWAEMPFTLGLKGFDARQLDQWVGQAIAPGQPRPALQAQQFEGLLTGVMDLVFAHQTEPDSPQRYAVLDYKTNRIANCEPQTLMQAVLAHRYDVQAVMYALAMHRLLKHRYPHSPATQQLSGVMFWFVRGLADGALWITVPPTLIQQLDKAWPS